MKIELFRKGQTEVLLGDFIAVPFKLLMMRRSNVCTYLISLVSDFLSNALQVQSPHGTNCCMAYRCINCTHGTGEILVWDNDLNKMFIKLLNFFVV